MTRRTANELPDDIKRTTELVRLNGAMRADAVCQALGYGRDYGRQVLDSCPALFKCRIDRITHYATRAECERRLKAAAAANKVRWAENARKAREAASVEIDEDEREDLPMKRAIVPAACAPRPVTRAPRSVFEWRPA